MKPICNAMAVLVMLGLAGCGSTSGAGGTPTSSSSAAAEDVAGAPAPQTTTGEIDGVLNGSWWAAAPDATVVLHINGHRVELLGGGGRCEGAVAEEDGIPTIRVQCTYPHAKRTVGKVWGLTEKGMTVDWEGFGADSFQHAVPDDTGV
jgi:hypothetical protein